jgi:hypothetical protein
LTYQHFAWLQHVIRHFIVRQFGFLQLVIRQKNVAPNVRTEEHANIWHGAVDAIGSDSGREVPSSNTAKVSRATRLVCEKLPKMYPKTIFVKTNAFP